MGVATAIIGGAVIGAAASIAATSIASSSNEEASRNAANAARDSVNQQVGETRRQFDLQMQIMQPLLQTQYAANQAFADLMGYGDMVQTGLAAPPGVSPFGSGGLTPPGGTPFGSDAGAGPIPGLDLSGAGFKTGDQGIIAGDLPVKGQQDDRYGFSADRQGFFDPNLDPTRFGAETAAESELGQFYAANRLAGETVDEDIAMQRVRDAALFRGLDEDALVRQARERRFAPGEDEDIGLRRARENLLAAPTLEEDERFRLAREGEVVGPTFEESPGYRFQVEEAERALDRRLSRGGGSFGGRAVQEAQRRAVGLAQQDYYNYVRARQTDLDRQERAVAAYQGRQAGDIQRGDVATQDYIRRQGVDISRETGALQDARRREELDVRRGDIATLNFLNRRASDISLGREAILQNQQQQQRDQQRQDQSYYNYLAQLGAAAGIGGNPAGRAVGASQFAGGAIGGAYGQLGAQLGNIYQQAGANQASIYSGGIAGVNQNIQQGISNYLAYQGAGGLGSNSLVAVNQPGFLPPGGGLAPPAQPSGGGLSLGNVGY